MSICRQLTFAFFAPFVVTQKRRQIADPRKGLTIPINEPGSILKIPPRHGKHGAMLRLFFRGFEGRTFAVGAEIKLHECWRTPLPMQNELDIVRDVSVRLDGAGLAYMLTGSIAMNECWA